MGREIRRVPKNWNHPKKQQAWGEDYIPLSDDYVGYLKYWKEDVDQFIKCMTEVIEKGKTKIYDTTYTDVQEVFDYLNEDNQMLPANPENYMPSGPWYQLFETVSEGTPLSPPFATPEELIEHLVEHGDSWKNVPWSRENAEAMLKQGFTLSGVVTGGKIYQNEEAFEIDRKDISREKN